MNIFIVNLESSIDRKLVMDKQLSKYNANVEYIKAVDGRKLSQEELKRDVFMYPDIHLSLGEIGCSLSHLKIYQKMIDENISHALILEDDVVIPEDFLERVNKINSTGLIERSEPIAILLSNHGARCTKRDRITINDSEYISRIYGSMGGYAYLINLPAAKKLVENLYPIKFESDRWGLFVNLGLLKLYKVFPYVFTIQVEDKTTMDQDLRAALFKTRREDTKKILRKIGLKNRVIYLFYKFIYQLDLSSYFEKQVTEK